MPKEINFQANNRNIKETLFQNTLFKVPRYQRPYSWSEDQVSEFWNDLNDNENFFLGSFIFNHEFLEKDGYIEVVDGQQRILTITIFIAVVRDLAKTIEIGLAEYFHKHMIVFELSYLKWSPRIICGDSTMPFYSEYIQSFDKDTLISKPQTPEEKLIKNNYVYFYDKLKAELDTVDGNEKKKALLENYVVRVEDLFIVYIKISKEEDAYEIFETTNARGVELNIADLLKNWIFKNIRQTETKDLAKQIWQDIESNVQGEMRKFLRYYWLSGNPAVTERRLYKAIKNKIVNWDSFLDELWRGSDSYNWLILPSEEQWLASKYSHAARLYKSIAALNTMNVSQCYVFILCIMRNYPKLGMDPVRIIEAIEKFSFIYSAISSQPANKVEKLYNGYALKLEQIVNKDEVSKTTASKVNQLFQTLENDLRALKPPFELFQKSFMEVKYKNTESARLLIRYILYEVNRHYEGTKEHKIDSLNVNIEHILPVNPDASWKVSKKEIQRYGNLLGNLTILDKVLNSKAGNKSVQDKLDLLKQSTLPVTKNVVVNIESPTVDWNEERIIRRQVELAKLAYNDIWKY